MSKKFDTIKEGLVNAGFMVDDNNKFTFEKIHQNHIIINGQHGIQEEKHIFQMQYIGDGCELDDDHNDIEGKEFCGFDILDEGGHSVTTIFVSDVDDFRKFLRLW